MSIYSLFQEIDNCSTVNNYQKKGDRFVLIEHTFFAAFTNVRHSENLSELSESLKMSIKNLAQKYEEVLDYKVIYSKDNQLIAYQGYWFDGENHYLHEGGIIRANCLE